MYTGQLHTLSVFSHYTLLKRALPHILRRCLFPYFHAYEELISDLRSDSGYEPHVVRCLWVISSQIADCSSDCMVNQVLIRNAACRVIEQSRGAPLPLHVGERENL